MKKLLIIGIVVMLAIVGFSGCFEESNKNPTASISADLIIGAAPLIVGFIGSGSDADGTIESYSWDFGDDSTSTEQEISHIFQTSGTYTVTLTVTDDDGAVGTATIVITVGESPVGSEVFFVTPNDKSMV